MGDAPDGQEEEIVPRFKEYVWKPARSRSAVQDSTDDSNKLFKLSDETSPTTPYLDGSLTVVPASQEDDSADSYDGNSKSEGPLELPGTNSQQIQLYHDDNQKAKSKSTIDWADDVEEAIEHGELPDFARNYNVATANLSQENCGTKAVNGDIIAKIYATLDVIKRQKAAAAQAQLPHLTQTPLPPPEQSPQTEDLRTTEPPPEYPTPKSVGLAGSRWA